MSPTISRWTCGREIAADQTPGISTHMILDVIPSPPLEVSGHQPGQHATSPRP